MNSGDVVWLTLLLLVSGVALVIWGGRLFAKCVQSFKAGLREEDKPPPDAR